MEEQELEEGEARPGNEEEEETCVDPDVALSYIDEKIHDILGHFQKDFEGGVCAENLGAKFGGYGSFLPAYRCSPSIWSQPKGLPKTSNHNGLTSSIDPLLVGTRCNPSSEMGTPFFKHNNTSSTAQPLENPSKRDTFASSFGAGDLGPQHNSSNGQHNGSNQRTLKVRIKVGLDNILARNNSDIYSGLGLDISPSSSPEDSPVSIGGLSPALGGAPSETPTTILQIMTCFPVPGGYVLSPLPESLLCLTEERSPDLENSKTGAFCNDISHTSTALTQAKKDVNSSAGKNSKLKEKNRSFRGAKNLNCKDDIGTDVRKEVGMDTVAEVVSNDLNIPPLCSSITIKGKVDRHMIGESAKTGGGICDHSREPNMISSPHRKYFPEMRLESVGGKEISGIATSGNETTHFNEKLNPGTNSAVRAHEKRKMTLSGLCSEKRDNIWDVYDINKVSYAGNNVDPTELVKLNPTRKARSFEEGREKILHNEEQLSEGNRKSKKSQAIATLSMELPKENINCSLSLSSQEKKKNFCVRGGTSEKLSEPMKSYNGPNKHESRESHNDVVSSVKADQVDIKGCFSEIHCEYKPQVEIDKSKEVLGSKNFDNPPFSKSLVEAPVMSNALTLSRIAAPCDPVVTKDNRVLCDKCRKWRLLPDGKSPDCLPKKWQCKMLDWLPGMNNCQVSEEETTEALYLLYYLPVPGSDCNVNGHIDVAASSVALADKGHLTTKVDLPAHSKKKYAGKDASCLSIQSAVVRASNSVGKAQEASNKSGSIHDTDQATLELVALNKNGFQQKSKSLEFATELHELKPKEKQKTYGCFSDGGYFIDRCDKHAKFKSKRIVGQDGRTPNKMELERSRQHVEYCHSDYELFSKAAPTIDNGMSAKVSGMDLQKYNDNSSLKDSQYNSTDDFPLSGSKSSGQVQGFSGKELKENFSISGVDISDGLELAAKKRKVKEPQGSLGPPIRSQHFGDHRFLMKEDLSESDMLRERKSKISKTERKEFSTRRADERADEKGCLPRILAPADKADRIEAVRRDYNDHEQHQWSASCRGALDGIDFLKKDLGRAQPSTTASSSSSMVSGSRKSKINFQEGKGSPVESVSSSPLRVPDMDKLATRGNSVTKDDFLNLDLLSSKKGQDGEVDGGCFQSGGKERLPSAQQSFFASHASVGPGVIESTRKIFSCDDKLENKLSSVDIKDGMDCGTAAATRDVSLPADFGVCNVVSDVAKSNGYIVKASDNDRFHVKDKSRVCNQTNGSGKWKLGNNSGYRERNSSNEANFEKDKLQNADRLSNQEECCSSKKGKSYQSKAGSDSQQHSIYHENLRDQHCNFKKDGKELLGKNSMCRREYEETVDGDTCMHLKQHKDFNSTVRIVGINCDKSFVCENLEGASLAKVEKSSNQLVLDRSEKSEIETGRGNSDAVLRPGDKQEMQIHSCHSTTIPVKETCSEAYPIDAAGGDRSKVVNQPKKPEVQDFEYCGTSRQPAPNEQNGRSPFRMDGQSSANVILKEARHLKHMADRLKNEGQELESTGLYFQAALKYLHGASLLESSSFGSAKHGEVVQSVKIYSDTAKLCGFCAHEYERCREMAAAALAYKCMEVAYFKVTYHKYPIASKDRHELQTALQLVPPGESASSSTSDMDNLNTNGLISRAALVKSVCSPQIAGHAAQNCSNIIRWLDYMNEVICAFEASRKSQNAFAVANASEEKYGSDGLSSVRKVLDLSFHNIQELLQLVRLSIESISL